MTSDHGNSSTGTVAAKPQQVSNWNLPNALTMLRIIFVPVFSYALIKSQGQDFDWMWASFLIFVALMITDKLDGDIARARGLITNFGKIADPIADKALILAALIGLSLIGSVPFWMTFVIIGRELLITLWRLLVLRRGVVVPASKGGKLKTVVQSLAIALYLLPLPTWLYFPRYAIMFIAVIITAVTGVQYIAATVFPNSKLVQLFADKPTATPPPAEISVLSSKAISRLQERGETIGTCESLTAGLLSAEIAAIPGASQVFRGALVTYATDLKIQLAGVDAAYIAAHGVIDAGTVSQMATGAKQRLGTDWAIALSGVAGPDTQDGHPVGEVWLAIQGPGTTAIVTKLGNPLLSGSREEIRLAAVKLSLEELLKLLG